MLSIDRFRMRWIKRAVCAAWWLARPTFRGKKILQHWEICLNMDMGKVPGRYPHLLAVRRGSLLVGGEPVLHHGVDLGITQMVDDLTEGIENNRPEGQGEKP